MRVEPRDAGGEHADGRRRGRHGGVPALSLRRQLDRDISLFRDPDERYRRGDARDQPRGERPSFVQHEFGVHVARGQELRDARGAAPTAHLLVVPEREVQRTPGLRARGDEMLDRLEQPHEAALVVQGAAPPHVPSRDPSLERRLGPAAFRSRLDRDDILVGEQDQRREPRVGAGPLVQQAVAVHFRELERGVQFREGIAQVAVQPLELARVELTRILERDGLEAQRAGEPACQRRRVERLDGATWGWREGKLTVRSSVTAASTTTTSANASRARFMGHRGSKRSDNGGGNR